MKRPITIVVKGTMHQIRDYGLKDIKFKYADDDEIIKKLSGLK